MAILLETKNLSKEYHNVKAVDSFSISMEEGHIYGIIGPNGAGKTTFFKMLAGLAQPTAGEITVSGNRTIEEYRQKMSFMIEAPYLYHGMTAMENMKIIGGIKGETDEKKLQEILELLNIGNTGKKKVGQFSLGMKQRLGIAGALITEPEVLVLDEPMNGVAPEGIAELRHILKKLCEEKHITMLISSHILGELSQLSTDFIFIKEGRILDQFRKEDLLNKENGYVQIGTTENDRLFPYLQKISEENAIENKGNFYRIKLPDADVALLSGEITGQGFTITRLLKENIELEEYYLERMVQR